MENIQTIFPPHYKLIYYYDQILNICYFFIPCRSFGENSDL